LGVSFTIYILLLLALKKKSCSLEPCSITNPEVELNGGIYIGEVQLNSGMLG